MSAFKDRPEIEISVHDAKAALDGGEAVLRAAISPYADSPLLARLEANRLALLYASRLPRS